MNIVNKLTLRHLKQNKRRTLVTIIGIIISVAMFTAVTTLGVSFMDLFKRAEIANSGEWHVLYKSANKEQIKGIENDPETKDLILSRDIGYAPIAESKNKRKPYLFIREYSTKGFSHFPIDLKDGRLPKKDGELAISDEALTNGKLTYKIGDRITLNAGQRQSTSEGSPLLGQNSSLETDEKGKRSEKLIDQKKADYVITGIIKRPEWEPAWAPGYTAVGYVDENSISGDETLKAFVAVNKVKGSIFNDAKQLAASLQLKDDEAGSPVSFNNELLRYYGVTNNDGLFMTMYSLVAIIMAIIIIGSISLIYNAFAISVSERARHLGMLSSVGATKKQKRNSVFFEGFVIGALSIPIGIASGIFGMWVTFQFINNILNSIANLNEELELTVTLWSVLTAILVSAATIFISTYLPARKASKITAIEAIRQSQDIKLTGKTVKTSKLVRLIFGIEAEIGLKNLKRNKRRYKATVFSLVISILLFLTVSFFTDSLQRSLAITQADINFDIRVGADTDGQEEQEEIARTISSLKNVTESNVIKSIDAITMIKKEDIASSLKQEIEKDPELLQEGKYRYEVTILSLTDKQLKSYRKEAGLNEKVLKDLDRTDQLSAIVINKAKYENPADQKFVEEKVLSMDAGRKLDLEEIGEDGSSQRVKIAALTDTLPVGVMDSYKGNFTIIVSEEVLEQLLKSQKNRTSYMNIYLMTDDPMKVQYELEDLDDSRLNIYNVHKMREEQEQMVTLLSIFTYGFIALITAISIANIFNTISTSIALRKREFAMLKSVGMTSKGFNKMMNYESIFYGIKSLLYGLPLSIGVMYLIYQSMMPVFEYRFQLPWLSLFIAIAAVFLIVGASMIYSISKIKKENIIDGLKQENI